MECRRVLSYYRGAYARCPKELIEYYDGTWICPDHGPRNIDASIR